MRDSKWQHNVTKGTPPSTKKKTTFLIFFAQHCNLWSSLGQAATRLAAVSTEVPPPLATGKPSSSCFDMGASYHAIQVNHLLYMDSLLQIKCSALTETKANGPGNSFCMPSNNEGTLQVTIIGASVHKCQDLHTSRLFFGAAEPPLEMDSQGLCSGAKRM